MVTSPNITEYKIIDTIGSVATTIGNGRGRNIALAVGPVTASIVVSMLNDAYKEGMLQAQQTMREALGIRNDPYAWKDQVVT